jgi:hypothetical protein
MPSSSARALGAAAAARAAGAAVVTGSAVQSGWPGIGGTVSPYSQLPRKPVRLRCDTWFTCAIHCSVLTDSSL